MTKRADNSNRGNQKAVQPRKPGGPDPKAKEEERTNADVSGANDTGNKSQGGKFDSGNQTNR